MKKVLVFGVGVAGQSAIKYYQRHDVEYVWYDDKPNDELISNGFLKVELKFDGNFENILYVLKSEGISNDHELLVSCRGKNIEILGSLDIFSKYVKPSRIIAITGTNGKTTTTTLVEKILNDAGMRAVACGNFGRGVLDYVDDDGIDYYVVELSSFQLELAKTFHPGYAVVLNISPDHLEWHKSYENYISAKLNVFTNMILDDIAIINGKDEVLQHAKINAKRHGIWSSVDNSDYIDIANDKVIYRSTDEIELLSVDDIRLPGRHNRENIMAAVLVCYLIGVAKEKIAATISDFYGVDHRLRLIAVNSGVSCYDDSKGTNPDSTIKAVEALESDILLILGGYDKKVSFDDLIELCKKNVKAIAALGQTQGQIIETCNRLGYDAVYPVEDMNSAVAVLMQESCPGDKLLLSPACASWGMYKNYVERGEDFIRVLNNLVI